VAEMIEFLGGWLQTEKEAMTLPSVGGLLENAELKTLIRIFRKNLDESQEHLSCFFKQPIFQIGRFAAN
jgi:hypothetical protein